MSYPTEWVQTDASTNQWGRQISGNKFEFKQDNLTKKVIEKEEQSVDLSSDPDTIQFEVDLSDYTLKDIENCIKGFYESIQEIIKIYQDEWKWIIAECIFETEA